jgi:hypothetical protein
MTLVSAVMKLYILLQDSYLVLKGLYKRIDVLILHGFTQLVFKIFLVCYIQLGHETLCTAT